MFKRILSMVMVMVLLFGLSAVSYAESIISTDKIIVEGDSAIQPLYNYTSDYSTGLTNSGSTATCKASLTGINGTTTKFVIKMTLQKKTLLWWSEVETWNATYNTYYGTLSKTASVKSGTYRVKAVYTVYSGSNNESITDYSDQKKV